MKANPVVCCILAILLGHTTALDFWSLLWSGSDCTGQVTLGVKYLGNCEENQHHYCAIDIPTTTIYNGTTCDSTQLFDTIQYPSNNCLSGKQFVCSDQPPQGLMLYYSTTQHPNCTGLITQETWQARPGVCMFLPQQNSYAVLSCNNTNFPWYNKCNDSSCHDCFDSSPFQVIPVSAGQCSGGYIIDNPNICHTAPVGLNDNPTIYINNNETYSSISVKQSVTTAYYIILTLLILF